MLGTSAWVRVFTSKPYQKLVYDDRKILHYNIFTFDANCKRNLNVPQPDMSHDRRISPMLRLFEALEK